MSDIKNIKAYLAGLIVLLTFIVYFNSLHAPFIFDDTPRIINNPDIKLLSNIPSKLVYPNGTGSSSQRNDPSRPLVFLTFTLNYYFGNLDPFGYHLFNVLLHICNALLIFVLAGKLYQLAYKKESNLFALLAALF